MIELDLDDGDVLVLQHLVVEGRKREWKNRHDRRKGGATSDDIEFLASVDRILEEVRVQAELAGYRLVSPGG